MYYNPYCSDPAGLSNRTSLQFTHRVLTYHFIETGLCLLQLLQKMMLIRVPLEDRALLLGMNPTMLDTEWKWRSTNLGFLRLTENIHLDYKDLKEYTESIMIV